MPPIPAPAYRKGLIPLAQPNRSRWGGRTIAKYVLAADYTLMTDYRNVPLATFFSCIPTDQWQSRLVFRILANPPKLDRQGRPIRAPYGLRKIEASLVQARARLGRHRRPAAHRAVHRRRHRGRGHPLHGPARARPRQHVLHDGRGPDAVHEG